MNTEQEILQAATERLSAAVPKADEVTASVVTLARLQLAEFLLSALFSTHPAQSAVLARLELLVTAHRRIAESHPDEGARRCLLAINDATRALAREFQAQQRGAPGVH